MSSDHDEQNGGEKKSGGASLNNISIIGNIGVAPEWKHKEDQNPFCVFTVGVSRGKRVGNEYDTLWYRITLWGKLAEKAVKYGVRTQQVYVQGRLAMNEWQDSQGKTRMTPEIAGADFQMLGKAEDALIRELTRLDEKEAVKESSRRQD